MRKHIEVRPITKVKAGQVQITDFRLELQNVQ
jgi:hypothetical protein